MTRTGATAKNNMKIHNVEQGSEKWRELRKGKLTGTSASLIVGYREMLRADLIEEALGLGLEFDQKKIKVQELKALIEKEDPNFSFRKMEKKVNEDLQYKMIAIELAGDADADPTHSENPMQRGHRLEPEARKLFEDVTGKKVSEVGFVTLDEEERVGLSPDGLIEVDGEYREAIEIKSPCNWKYVKYWLENKIPTEYKEQVLDYFVQSEKIEKVYLILFNPNIKIHPFTVFVAERDDYKFEVALMKEAQIEFWKGHDERMKKIIN